MTEGEKRWTYEIDRSMLNDGVSPSVALGLGRIPGRVPEGPECGGDCEREEGEVQERRSRKAQKRKVY